MTYYTYMLRCTDNSIYTGITTDLNRRFRQHSGEKDGGAKYTKFRQPLKYEQVWSSQDRATASKLEYRIKRLSKVQKELLVQKPDELNVLMKEKIDCSCYVLLDEKQKKGV